MFGSSKEEKLLKASRKGNLKKMEKLISEGVSVNSKSKRGNTPISFAAGNGHKDAVELLIARGASVTTDEGAQALNSAVAAGNEDMVMWLISKGASVNSRDEEGWLPINEAILFDNKDMVRLLISKGADINDWGGTSRSPLIGAAKDGKKDIAILLLLEGAYYDEEDFRDIMSTARIHDIDPKRKFADDIADILKASDRIEDFRTMLQVLEDLWKTGDKESFETYVTERLINDISVAPELWMREAMLDHIRYSCQIDSVVREELLSRLEMKDIAMGLCDICNRPDKGEIVKAKEMSRAVRKGFDPLKEELVPLAFFTLGAEDGHDAWLQSAISGQLSMSDWNVCDRCMTKLKPYLS